MFFLRLPIPTPSPLQTFIYWHYTSIYQLANKTRHTHHSESHQLAPHTHPQAKLSGKVKLVKSLKGGGQSKGHRGNSLNDCNLC